MDDKEIMQYLPIYHFVICILIQCVIVSETLILYIFGQVYFHFGLMYKYMIFVRYCYHISFTTAYFWREQSRETNAMEQRQTYKEALSTKHLKDRTIFLCIVPVSWRNKDSHQLIYFFVPILVPIPLAGSPPLS